MVSSCWKPLEGKVNMGEVFTDPVEQGGRGADIRAIIPVHCAGNTNFGIRDVGGDPPHRNIPGGVPL